MKKVFNLYLNQNIRKGSRNRSRSKLTFSVHRRNDPRS